MYDVARGRGYLLNALNYDERKRKANDPVTDVEKTWSDEDTKEMLSFFKHCVLPKEKESVKKMMSKTTQIRRSIILSEFETYRESYQFYFVCPELVRLLYIALQIFEGTILLLIESFHLFFLGFI